MTATETQQANVALAGAVTALYTGDSAESLAERFDEFFTEDFAWHSAIITGVEGEAWRGREGWERWGRELFESFEYVRVDRLAHTPIGDDTVLSLGRARVLGRDSRAELESEISFVWRMRDGRVASCHGFLSHERGRQEAQRAP